MAGTRTRTRQGTQGPEDDCPCACFQPEKDWEESWEEEEGKRSDPKQVADPLRYRGATLAQD